MTEPVTLLPSSWHLVASATLTASGNDVTRLYADMMTMENQSSALPWLVVRGLYNSSNPRVAWVNNEDGATGLFNSHERLIYLMMQSLPFALPTEPFGVILTCPEGSDYKHWIHWHRLKDAAASHRITHNAPEALTTLAHAQQEQPSIVHWLWLSVDSLIDKHYLLERGDQLMHYDNPEGQMAGEAMVLLHFSRIPASNSVQLGAVMRAEKPHAADSLKETMEALPSLIQAVDHIEDPLTHIVCNANVGRLHASELHKTRQTIVFDRWDEQAAERVQNDQATDEDNPVPLTFQSYYTATGDTGLAGFPLALALGAQYLADPENDVVQKALAQNQAQARIGCADLHHHQRLFVTLTREPATPEPQEASTQPESTAQKATDYV